MWGEVLLDRPATRRTAAAQIQASTPTATPRVTRAPWRTTAASPIRRPQGIRLVVCGPAAGFAGRRGAAARPMCRTTASCPRHRPGDHAARLPVSSEMSELVRRAFKATPRQPGVEEIRIPSERAFREREQRRVGGHRSGPQGGRRADFAIAAARARKPSHRRSTRSAATTPNSPTSARDIHANPELGLEEHRTPTSWRGSLRNGASRFIAASAPRASSASCIRQWRGHDRAARRHGCAADPGGERLPYAASNPARCTPAAMTATPRCCSARRAIWPRRATSTGR